MLAVVKTGGKQYLVEPGKKIKVEKLEGKEGDKVTLDQVLCLAEEDGSKLELAMPKLAKKVTATIVKQGRADKVLILKQKSKKRYKVKKGHRQSFTELLIEKIG